MKTAALGALIALISQPASATVFAPFLDGYFKSVTTGIVVVPTLHIQPAYTKINGIFYTFLVKVPDQHVVKFLSLKEIKVITYVEIPDNVPSKNSPAIFYEIISQSLGLSTTLDVTGFDPVDPQVTNIGPSSFFGKSGTQYDAFFSATSSLSGLPTLLPGFDLSPFSGDPNSIVYVSKTAIPLFDIAAIPEPASWALMIMGLATVGAALRTRRRSELTCRGSELRL